MQNKFNCGVLMIGSLYWDDEERTKWREKRLQMSEAVRVFAPIRYGRISKFREKTYTMIFDRSCYQLGMGIAWLAPVKNPIRDIYDLKEEAKKLWDVEGGQQGSILGSWGSVGILKNPNTRVSSHFINEWKDFYINEKVETQKIFEKNELPSISENGLLLLDWIETIDGKKVVEADIILAAATVPEKGEIPTAEKIAEASNKVRYWDYIENNIMNGIITFQDEEILSYRTGV